ncbi:MAG: AarF/ABC1/UbiB kinase family protein [Actinobacteria bacterium]|nr:AarF/ABC1/UbiB kinase family protein [Actinomycetota bacterium]
MTLERITMFGVAAILLISVMVGLTALLQRTFDVRVSATRLGAATVAGALVELLIEQQFMWRADLATGVQVLLQVLVAVVVAVGLLLASEVIMPSGALPSPLRWPALLRDRASRTGRYGEILRILSRHRLLPPGIPGDAAERREHARELRLALEEAGVAFVKMGQVLSTRPEIVTPEYILELTRLQEQAEPLPSDVVRQAFEESTGVPLEEAFEHFDDEPLASASIAQVHRARLHGGREVAVKIQRPGIAPVVERDLDIARRIALSVEKASPDGGTLGAVDLVDGFAANLREELDFTREARNLAAIAVGLARHDDGVVVPWHSDLSTREVLIMEELPGRTLATEGFLQALPVDERREIADRLFRSLLNQILVDGIFHADPHPGNIMILPDGTVALIDLGSVGRLTKDDRQGLMHLLHAVQVQDAEMLTDAILQVVDRSANLEVDRLQRALGAFMTARTGPGARADMEMFGSLTRLLARFDLRVPPNLAGAFRAIATVEGTLRALDPEFDVMAEGTRFADEHLGSITNPLDFIEAVKDEAMKALPQLRALPRQLSLIAGDLEHGRTTVNIRAFSDSGDRRFLTFLINELVIAAVGITLAIVATVLVVFGPHVTLQVLGGVIGAIAAILIQRVLYVAFRKPEV